MNYCTRLLNFCVSSLLLAPVLWSAEIDSTLTGGSGNWSNNASWDTNAPNNDATDTYNVVGTTSGGNTNVNGNFTINSITNAGDGSAAYNNNWNIRTNGQTRSLTILDSVTANNVNGTQTYNQYALQFFSQDDTGLLTLNVGGSVNALAGTLTLGGLSSDGVYYNFTGTTTQVASGALLRIHSFNDYNLGDLTNNGKLQLHRTDAYSGIVTVTDRSVTVNSLAGAGSLSANARDNATVNATLLVNQSINTTYSGILLDNDATEAGTAKLDLVKTGTGALTLSGANTFTGGVQVDGGSLVIANSSALGGGDVDLDSGTLDMNGAATQLADVGGDFHMNGGILSMSYESGGSTFDYITGSTGATFTIVGGQLDLGNYDWDYEESYGLFVGFDSGSVSGLSITNYDTANYLAVLGNDGVLSFSVIPEPGSYALMAGSLALVSVMCRRRSMS